MDENHKSSNRHKNYETLNLIGYGLAKFNNDFIKELGFKSKTDFYNYVVKISVAETSGVVKNRQDLFDPFFDNKRKGWWQKGDAYIHRKLLIDSLFGTLDVKSYCEIVKLSFYKISKDKDLLFVPTPIQVSMFKQLQTTGREAELYFQNNFRQISEFSNGIIDDARFFGDGYDFQIRVNQNNFLAEVKGLRNSQGSIRFTQNEYQKAKQYKQNFVLIVVCNLYDLPKMSATFDPTSKISFTQKQIRQLQKNYYSESRKW